jgi:SWI/SNF related-matrix-associated actin-dependent regulator of chromatin subfamily C
MNIPANHEQQSHTLQALSRQRVGMEPKSIVIGDRLKHTVHNGALKLPPRALDLITELAPQQLHNPEPVVLPSVDSVLRPTMDVVPITVTYLRQEKFTMPGKAGEEGGEAVPVEELRTVAENRSWNRPREATLEKIDEPDRIRGGGGESEGVSQEKHGHDKAETGNVAATEASLHKTDAEEAKPTGGSATEPSQTVENNNAPPTTSTQESSSFRDEAPKSDPDPIAGSGSATEVKAGDEPEVQEKTTSSETHAMTTQSSVLPQPSETSSNPISSAPSTAVPATTTSSSATVAISNPVVPLPKTPAPQYAQHIPGPNDEMPVEIKNSRPDWYTSDGISEIERTLLPEWFNGSAQHRTQESYIQTREQVLKMSTDVGNRYVTTSLIRRTVPGDIGSLMRLHQFLVSYSMINADAINDSTPTAESLRENRKRSLATRLQEKLADIVLKKQKSDGTVDWEGVADQIGDGVTTADCKREFMSIDFDQITAVSSNERSITPEPRDARQRNSLDIQEIIDTTDDSIVIPTVDTALRQTQNLKQAQNAAISAVVVSRVMQKAVGEEESLSLVLADLNEKRVQRVEKRIELLNDIEGMMEAERMALELERRDLYTQRCRLWFGGSG